MTFIGKNCKSHFSKQELTPIRIARIGYGSECECSFPVRGPQKPIAQAVQANLSLSNIVPADFGLKRIAENLRPESIQLVAIYRSGQEIIGEDHVAGFRIAGYDEFIQPAGRQHDGS